MKEPEEKEKIVQFVIFPRVIASDFREGKLPPNEWRLLMWLRLNMNPYGITSVSISSLGDDIFRGVSHNYIEKLILSLRKKKYLYFENRKGRRGSFDVKFGDVITPDGHILSIEHFFGGKEVISDEETKPQEDNEVSHTSEVQSHKLREQISDLAQGFSVNRTERRVIGSYNDTEIENKKDNYELSNPSNEDEPRKKVATRTYVPKNDNEERCRDIAYEIGDPYMSFVMSVFHDKQNGGLETLEEGLRQYKQAKRKYEDKGERVKNPPALFNKCVKALMEDKKFKTNRSQSNQKKFGHLGETVDLKEKYKNLKVIEVSNDKEE